jgi:hypothetical protein
MALRYKQGDKVRFLNDVGGGIITRVEDNGTVYVETPDGFEIPVSVNDVIHARGFALEEKEETGGYKTQNQVAPKTSGVKRAPEAVKPKPPVNLGEDVPVRMMVGFIAENQGPVFNSPIACYLINDSPFFAFYSIGTWERGVYYHVDAGLIESDTKNLVKVFDQTALSRINGLHIQVIWYSAGKYRRKPPVDQLVDIHLVNFSKESYFRTNEFFEEKAVLFSVTGKEEAVKEEEIEVPRAVVDQKSLADGGKYDPVKKKEPVPDTLEIDLHLDELAPGANQFTQQGFLALQMSKFHAALDEAISKKMRKLVVIHGVGQGTLKTQIRKELQEKYPGYLFQDASFREYGFGATMVHLTTDKKQ